MNNDYVFIDGKIPFYQSKLFNKYGVPHAFFTRIGGVSSGVFESLNFAIGSGTERDSEENLIKNQRRKSWKRSIKILQKQRKNTISLEPQAAYRMHLTLLKLPRIKNNG